MFFIIAQSAVDHSIQTKTPMELIADREEACLIAHEIFESAMISDVCVYEWKGGLVLHLPEPLLKTPE